MAGDKVVENVYNELSSILGKRVSRDPVDLGLHVVDASSYYFTPKDLHDKYILAMPKDPEEVSEIVKIASRHGLPVIPQGSSTDLSMGSGSVSLTTANQIYMLERGIILYMGMMGSIIEISDIDRIAVVEPGVRIDSFNETLAETDLFFPVDPASARAATIGGAIATGAGGLRGARYGTMRDWVLGLEFVDGLGRIHRVGCRTIKCRQGYDITRLMVGSEGTLGVITKAMLRLWPRPAAISRLMAIFNDFDNLYKFFLNIRRRRVPLIAEYMEDRVADKVIKTLGLSIPAGHTLILDLEAVSREEAERLLEILERGAREAGAFYTAVATDQDKHFDEIYRFRRSMYAGMVKMKRRKNIIFEDTAVPISRLPEFIKKIKEIEAKYGREIELGGHLGDGNLHPHIECDLEDSNDRSFAMEVAKEIVIEALKLGGTSSSEHGIGSMKLELLLIELKNKRSEYTIELMMGIKRVFDPKWILNPGRVIPAGPWQKI